MKNEKMHILKMLEEGKINADEAMKLLESISSPVAVKAARPKHIRVKVTESGKEVVNVNVPIAMAKTAFSVATKFGGANALHGTEEIDLKTVMDAIEQGAEGRVVEVNKGNKHIEVFIE